MTLTNEDLQAIANLLDAKIDQKLQPVSNRLDKIESGSLHSINSRLDNIESGSLNSINNRLDKIESEVSGLKVSQISMRKELKEVHQKVSDTYDLALEAWGKSTENRVWLEALPK